MKSKFLVLVIIAITFGESNCQNNCGTHEPFHPIITGSNFTVPGEHPWKAALFNQEGKYFCGGSLISNEAIVTSANCLKGKAEAYDFKAEDITVVLGVKDLSKSFEKRRVTIGVKSIHVHPDWNIYSDSYDGDIALLVLETEVQFGAKVQPICLSTLQSPSAQLNEGILIGFQKTEGVNKANKLTLKFKGYHSCIKQNENLLSYLSARTFCAGSGDEENDFDAGSGSGLYVFYNNRFYLRGTNSASLLHKKLDSISTYGIFADTLEYCGWIQSGGLNKYAQCSENDFSTSTTSQPTTTSIITTQPTTTSRITTQPTTTSRITTQPTTTSRITTQPTTTSRKTTRSTTRLRTTTEKPSRHILYGGDCLYAGEFIESPNKCFKVIYQEDGNFVVYRTSTMQVLWQSHTHGTCTNIACMQVQGNFVVYDCNKRAVWHSPTNGHPGARMIIQSAGNLVIYGPMNKALWWSRDYITPC